MSRHALPSLLPVLLLAACASQPDSAADAADAAPPMAAQCDADAAKDYIGQPASDENVEAARVAAGAQSVRSLKPGDAMTMDFRGDRANVMQDADGNIERITCG